MKRKAEFLTFLRYDDYSTMERLRFVLTSPFRFYTRTLQAEVDVPVGFDSDGRSSPRVVWGIVPPVGPALWAAIPHDFLYREGGYYIGRIYAPDGAVVTQGHFVPILQEQADAVYRELLIAKGFTRFRSWWSWRALRRFGHFAWNDHRARDPQ